MKSRSADNKHARISSSRWLAYATASAAATLGAHQAAAAIHYSGPVGFIFPIANPTKVTEQAFPLDQPADSIVFLHSNTHFLGSGFAGVAGDGLVSANSGAGSFDAYPAAKLPRGTYVSQGHFTFLRRDAGFGTLAGDYGKWHGGWGFIGVSFNDGSGQQYGWARIKMQSRGRGFAFKLADYAYADPGEPIRTGQTSEKKDAVADLPAEGSLGVHALGRMGLEAWRAGRRSE